MWAKRGESSFLWFLSALVKQHMFVLWPWLPPGIEGKLVSI